jgi:hypothetical protein
MCICSILTEDDACIDCIDSSLILKELLTSWNVGNELEAILDFAPRYLDYFLTSKKPSAIVKIYGWVFYIYIHEFETGHLCVFGSVYSIKIKDLRAGEMLQKVDLVVLENLFFQMDLTRVSKDRIYSIGLGFPVLTHIVCVLCVPAV